ncbi:NmrA family transcriptional regulator [Streptomyces spiroverticillatus]|uniref:NmrA family transcriptional regulator n=1 Tax=Streptomyces finlayi TaxID=67296 RepID=A0A919CEM8_9ACTN|nr:NmrA family transcriptional regulator [Streptomyces spiroverticillatus]GHD15458.1 NmrA family transcriptional regulator [Streptomyces finlayi]
MRTASRVGSAVRFDWEDPGSWDAAVVGVRAAYLVTPMDPRFPAAAVAGFVERAVAAGVRQLVLLSGLSAGYGSVPMLSREEPVRASGVAWTVLRPGAFQQNFGGPPYVEAFRGGELRLPVGAGPGPYSAYVDVVDVAGVAVEVLAAGGGHAGRVYELSGPRAWSFAEVVELVGEKLGRPVRFVAEPVEEWRERVRGGGAAEEAVAWSLETFEALGRGEYAGVHRGVREVLGREPWGLERYVGEGVRAGVWG